MKLYCAVGFTALCVELEIETKDVDKVKCFHKTLDLVETAFQRWSSSFVDFEFN